MGRPSLTRRITASTLVVSLFATQCLFAHSVESNFWAERKRKNQSNVVQLAQLSLPSVPSTSISLPVEKSLPRVLNSVAKNIPAGPLHDAVAALPGATGSIRKISPISSAKGTVVLIQDIHRNAEAQANIAKTIQALIDQKKTDVIALEGAFDVIDLARFRAFPQQGVIRNVADYLLREHKISGPVHAALTSAAAIPTVIGIDQKDLYDANVNAVRTSTAESAEVKAGLEKSARSLADRKQKTLNAALLAFDQKVDAYRRGDMRLGEFVENLGEEGEVAKFRQALRLETSLDFTRVEAERSRLLENLTTKLSPEETQTLLNMTVAFRLGHIRHSDFYDQLKSLCDRKGVKLSHLPSMDAYIRYVLLLDTIDVEKVLSEIRTLEEKAYRSLITNTEEKNLIAESRALYLAERLVNFELTPDEWTEYKKNPKRGLLSFEDFYRFAEKRDQAMAENLLRTKNSELRTVVLVAGGFHSVGLTAALNKAGYNVVNFTPQISKVDSDQGSSYLSVFTQEKTPLEKLFKGEKLFLAAHPMVDGRLIAGTGAGVKERITSGDLPQAQNQKDFEALAGEEGRGIAYDAQDTADGVVMEFKTANGRIEVPMEANANGEISSIKDGKPRPVGTATGGAVGQFFDDFYQYLRSKQWSLSSIQLFWAPLMQSLFFHGFMIGVPGITGYLLGDFSSGFAGLLIFGLLSVMVYGSKLTHPKLYLGSNPVPGMVTDRIPQSREDLIRGWTELRWWLSLEALAFGLIQMIGYGVADKLTPWALAPALVVGILAVIFIHNLRNARARELGNVVGMATGGRKNSGNKNKNAGKSSGGYWKSILIGAYLGLMIMGFAWWKYVANAPAKPQGAQQVQVEGPTGDKVLPDDPKNAIPDPSQAGKGKTADKGQQQRAPPAAKEIWTTGMLSRLDAHIDSLDTPLYTRSNRGSELNDTAFLYDNAIRAQEHLSERTTEGVRKAKELLNRIQAWPVRTDIFPNKERIKDDTFYAYVTAVRATTGETREYKVEAGPVFHSGIAAEHTYEMAQIYDKAGFDAGDYDSMLDLAKFVAEFGLKLRDEKTGGPRHGPWGAHPGDQHFGSNQALPEFASVLTYEYQPEAYSLWNFLSKVSSPKVSAAEKALYTEATNKVFDLIIRFWSKQNNRFRGVYDLEREVFLSSLPTDVQAWTISMVGMEKLLTRLELKDFENMFKELHARHTTRNTRNEIIGYDYMPDRGLLVSVEWTAQMALAHLEFAEYLRTHPDIARTISTPWTFYADHGFDLLQKMLQLKPGPTGGLHYAYYADGNPADNQETGYGWKTQNGESGISAFYLASALRGFDPAAPAGGINLLQTLFAQRADTIRIMPLPPIPSAEEVGMVLPPGVLTQAKNLITLGNYHESDHMGDTNYVYWEFPVAVRVPAGKIKIKYTLTGSDVMGVQLKPRNEDPNIRGDMQVFTGVADKTELDVPVPSGRDLFRLAIHIGPKAFGADLGGSAQARIEVVSVEVIPTDNTAPAADPAPVTAPPAAAAQPQPQTPAPTTPVAPPVVQTPAQPAVPSAPSTQPAAPATQPAAQPPIITNPRTTTPSELKTAPATQPAAPTTPAVQPPVVINPRTTSPSELKTAPATPPQTPPVNTAPKSAPKMEPKTQPASATQPAPAGNSTTQPKTQPASATQPAPAGKPAQQPPQTPAAPVTQPAAQSQTPPQTPVAPAAVVANTRTLIDRATLAEYRKHLQFMKGRLFVRSNVGDPDLPGWAFLYDNSIWAQDHLADNTLDGVRASRDLLVTIKTSWPRRPDVYSDEARRNPVVAYAISGAHADNGQGVEWKVDTGPILHLGLSAIKTYRAAQRLDPAGVQRGEYNVLLDIAQEAGDYALAMQDSQTNLVRHGPWGKPGDERDQRFGFDLNAPRLPDTFTMEHQPEAWRVWTSLANMSGIPAQRQALYGAAAVRLKTATFRTYWDKAQHRFRNAYDGPSRRTSAIFPTDVQAWAVSMFGVDELIKPLPGENQPFITLQDIEAMFAALDSEHAVKDGQGNILGYDYIPNRRRLRSVEWSGQVVAAKLQFARYLKANAQADAVVRTPWQDYAVAAAELGLRLGQLRRGANAGLAYAYDAQGQPAQDQPTGFGWDTMRGEAMISAAYIDAVARGFDPASVDNEFINLDELLGGIQGRIRAPAAVPQVQPAAPKANPKANAPTSRQSKAKAQQEEQAQVAGNILEDGREGWNPNGGFNNRFRYWDFPKPVPLNAGQKLRITYELRGGNVMGVQMYDEFQDDGDEGDMQVIRNAGGAKTIEVTVPSNRNMRRLTFQIGPEAWRPIGGSLQADIAVKKVEIVPAGGAAKQKAKGRKGTWSIWNRWGFHPVAAVQQFAPIVEPVVTWGIFGLLMLGLNAAVPFFTTATDLTHAATTMIAGLAANAVFALGHWEGEYVNNPNLTDSPEAQGPPASPYVFKKFTSTQERVSALTSIFLKFLLVHTPMFIATGFLPFVVNQSSADFIFLSIIIAQFFHYALNTDDSSKEGESRFSFDWKMALMPMGMFLIYSLNRDYNGQFIDESFYSYAKNVGNVFYLSGDSRLWPVLSYYAYEIGGILGVRTLTAFLGSVMVGSVAKAAVEIAPSMGVFKDKRIAGHMAALIFGVSAPVWLISTIGRHDALAFMLYAFAFWQLARGINRNDSVSLVTAAATLGLAFTVRTFLAPYIFGLVVYSFIAKTDNAGRAKAVGMFLFPLIVFIGFYVLVNSDFYFASIAHSKAVGASIEAARSTLGILREAAIRIWPAALLAIGAGIAGLRSKSAPPHTRALGWYLAAGSIGILFLHLFVVGSAFTMERNLVLGLIFASIAGGLLVAGLLRRARVGGVDVFLLWTLVLILSVGAVFPLNKDRQAWPDWRPVNQAVTEVAGEWNLPQGARIASTANTGEQGNVHALKKEFGDTYDVDTASPWKPEPEFADKHDRVLQLEKKAGTAMVVGPYSSRRLKEGDEVNGFVVVRVIEIPNGPAYFPRTYIFINTDLGEKILAPQPEAFGVLKGLSWPSMAHLVSMVTYEAQPESTGQESNVQKAHSDLEAAYPELEISIEGRDDAETLALINEVKAAMDFMNKVAPGVFGSQHMSLAGIEVKNGSVSFVLLPSGLKQNATKTQPEPFRNSQDLSRIMLEKIALNHLSEANYNLWRLYVIPEEWPADTRRAARAFRAREALKGDLRGAKELYEDLTSPKGTPTGVVISSSIDLMVMTKADFDKKMAEYFFGNGRARVNEDPGLYLIHQWATDQAVDENVLAQLTPNESAQEEAAAKARAAQPAPAHDDNWVAETLQGIAASLLTVAAFIAGALGLRWLLSPKKSETKTEPETEKTTQQTPTQPVARPATLQTIGSIPGRVFVDGEENITYKGNNQIEFMTHDPNSQDELAVIRIQGPLSMTNSYIGMSRLPINLINANTMVIGDNVTMQNGEFVNVKLVDDRVRVEDSIIIDVDEIGRDAQILGNSDVRLSHIGAEAYINGQSRVHKAWLSNGVHIVNASVIGGREGTPTERKGITFGAKSKFINGLIRHTGGDEEGVVNQIEIGENVELRNVDLISTKNEGIQINVSLVVPNGKRVILTDGVRLNAELKARIESALQNADVLMIETDGTRVIETGSIIAQEEPEFIDAAAEKQVLHKKYSDIPTVFEVTSEEEADDINKSLESAELIRHVDGGGTVTLGKGMKVFVGLVIRARPGRQVVLNLDRAGYRGGALVVADGYDVHLGPALNSGAGYRGRINGLSVTYDTSVTAPFDNHGGIAEDVVGNAKFFIRSQGILRNAYIRHAGPASKAEVNWGWAQGENLVIDVGFDESVRMDHHAVVNGRIISGWQNKGQPYSLTLQPGFTAGFRSSLQDRRNPPEVPAIIGESIPDGRHRVIEDDASESTGYKMTGLLMFGLMFAIVGVTGAVILSTLSAAQLGILATGGVAVAVQKALQPAVSAEEKLADQVARAFTRSYRSETSSIARTIESLLNSTSQNMGVAHMLGRGPVDFSPLGQKEFNVALFKARLEARLQHYQGQGLPSQVLDAAIWRTVYNRKIGQFRKVLSEAKDQSLSVIVLSEAGENATEEAILNREYAQMVMEEAAKFPRKRFALVASSGALLDEIKHWNKGNLRVVSSDRTNTMFKGDVVYVKAVGEALRAQHPDYMEESNSVLLYSRNNVVLNFDGIREGDLMRRAYLRIIDRALQVHDVTYQGGVTAQILHEILTKIGA